ncbi:diaminopimelate epimerase [Termitidicoccus mucosus]|uniref:Diaminopimelate epimerase n=1 Tax=Termitidicoccus mucosus TaxID=1184151 RepID=A0A178IEP8_9BACT|nr:diaminopimelate epimerase [Opitutaceae bacterium TSB47]
MRFHKYHALGNDYIVLDPSDFPSWQPAPTAGQIRVVCHRNFGVGSDGILWGPLPSKNSDFGLRIFNPDGSEAEKSGNGLRIFSRFLFDQKLVAGAGNMERGRPVRHSADELSAFQTGAAFTIETPGGQVRSVIKENGRLITVAMGRVSFDSAKIPVAPAGASREVVNETLAAGGRNFTFCAATIGNPHCVLPLPDAEVTAALAHRFGPHIETHPLFPHKTNVQFLSVLNRANIRIEIWERGAGYTLASGSSSSAAAAVAHRLGLVDRNVTVHMPGGKIGIEIGDGFSILMTGTVNKVADGEMHPDLFEINV